MQIQNFTVESVYDALPLSCTIYEPQGAPKGIFQIVHGMCEYKERYEGFLRFLAENGFVAAAHDIAVTAGASGTAAIWAGSGIKRQTQSSRTPYR